MRRESSASWPETSPEKPLTFRSDDTNVERPSPKLADGVAALLALVVLGYFLFVRQQPVVGTTVTLWILALQLAFRTRSREHSVVVFALGLFVLAGLFSGLLWLYLTNLIVAGFAYTIWTLKYAPGRMAST